MSSVNIFWEVIVPHHAWVKVGGSPSIGIRLRQTKQPGKLKQRISDPLLVAAVKSFTTAVIGEHNPNITQQINTFITNMHVDMDF